LREIKFVIASYSRKRVSLRNPFSMDLEAEGLKSRGMVSLGKRTLPQGRATRKR
jgi:hypothetical protein